MKYDITGQRFGRLVALEENGRKHKEVVWKCLCDCGNIKNITSSSLRYGTTRSCGCLLPDASKAANTKHGLYGTPIHRTYFNMKNRCYNPHYCLFKSYGGKGIKVCDEWLEKNGLQNFYEWSLKNGYSTELSIDRIDNDKGYSPDNCRWVTMKAQQNNRTNNRCFEIDGTIKTMKQWTEHFNISYKKFQHLVYSGMEPVAAINELVGK